MGRLLVPTTSLCHTIELMELQYREILELVIHMGRVRHFVTALEKYVVPSQIYYHVHSVIAELWF